MSHHGFDTVGIVNTVREVMKLDFEDTDDWDDEF